MKCDEDGGEDEKGEAEELEVLGKVDDDQGDGFRVPDVTVGASWARNDRSGESPGVVPEAGVGVGQFRQERKHYRHKLHD